LGLVKQAHPDGFIPFHGSSAASDFGGRGRAILPRGGEAVRGCGLDSNQMGEPLAIGRIHRVEAAWRRSSFVLTGVQV
jgi:hypothetical protein